MRGHQKKAARSRRERHDERQRARRLVHVAKGRPAAVVAEWRKLAGVVI